MNIVYLISRFAAKGPTNQLKYLCPIREKQNLIFSIMTIFNEKKLSIIDDFSDIRVSRLDFFKAINLYRYDLVHTSGLFPDLIGLCFVNKKKWILTVRNNPFQDYPLKFGAIPGNLIAYIHLFILKRCNNVLFCSTFLQNQLIRRGVSGTLLENAYPWAHKPRLSTISNSFLYVGSLIKRKNIKLLSYLFQSVPFSSSNLIVYGEGHESIHLKNNPNIELKGFSKSLSRIYQSPAIFISLSASEGLPNACLEAISHQCILVLSNIDPHLRLKDVFPDLILIVSLERLYENDYINQLAKRIDEVVSKYGEIDWEYTRRTYLEYFGQTRLINNHYNYYQEVYSS